MTTTTAKTTMMTKDNNDDGKNKDNDLVFTHNNQLCDWMHSWQRGGGDFDNDNDNDKSNKNDNKDKDKMAQYGTMVRYGIMV